jgi:hypothetical protein
MTVSPIQNSYGMWISWAERVGKSYEEVQGSIFHLLRNRVDKITKFLEAAEEDVTRSDMEQSVKREHILKIVHKFVLVIAWK